MENAVAGRLDGQSKAFRLMYKVLDQCEQFVSPEDGLIAAIRIALRAAKDEMKVGLNVRSNRNPESPEWRTVARIAGNLMATGNYKTPEIAVKAAREIVEESRKAKEQETELSLKFRIFTINGHTCRTSEMLAGFEPKDRDTIASLTVGQEFHVISESFQARSGMSHCTIRRIQ
jgi:hypothetical protein